jgi:FlaA1/EpsC-like NDP-sugar epimerase
VAVGAGRTRATCQRRPGGLEVGADSGTGGVVGRAGKAPWVPRGWGEAIARRSLRGPSDLALLVLDAVLIGMAYFVMLVVRYELDVPDDAWLGFLRFVSVALLLHLVANRTAGLYGPVWEQASVLEAQRILAAGGAATAALIAWNLVGSRQVPLSVAITGGLVATGLVGTLRFQSRLFAFRRRTRSDKTRVLVIGAGTSGGALLRELSREPDAAIQAVALLDDDPRKQGRRVGITPIAGTIDDLVEVGRARGVEQVLLAIPSADSALVRRVADASSELGVSLKVLPSVAELMNGQPNLRDVRDLSIDDLLGRQPVSTDLEAVRNLIRGRRVLVTGGGGSIGSEIVRQVAEYDPAELFVLDRDETHLFDAMAAIGGRGTAALLDIRDRDRLRRLFAAHRPEIVFHAAANKHVPLLEAHPAEAAATNILGTANLVAAAREAEVAHLVFISTDKAVQPRSVMGASKRMGEQLVLSGAPEGAAWCAVRFGNVLGSRGSVVPTFMRQIESGGPVTITDPQMTRFFMSIPEAVQLVLQASSLASDQEVFMLEMGEPVRIMDLAKRMISLAGLRVDSDIRIEVTGLRPGEKLTEELHTAEEHPGPTAHPKVLRLHPANASAARLRHLLERIVTALDAGDDARVKQLLLAESGRERRANARVSARSRVPEARWRARRLEDLARVPAGG